MRVKRHRVGPGRSTCSRGGREIRSLGGSVSSSGVAAPGVSDRLEHKWIERLTPMLRLGEEIWALAKANSIRPTLEGVMVTNARVVGFVTGFGYDDDEKAFKVIVGGDDIVDVQLHGRQQRELHVTTPTGGSKFGTLGKGDIEFVLAAIRRLQESGVADAVTNRVRTPAQKQENDEYMKRRELDNVERQRRGRTTVVGPAIADKEWAVIDRYCRSDEAPWFVLTTGSTGFLAAFEDRLLIAKTGAMAGFMAGATGGGRTTTFPFSDITNIEYNGGWTAGVLEVLTPSYQGSGNHDYWRSSNKGRNAASDDPRTLSNCLPLSKAVYTEALPKLNELEQKIIESKQPRIVMPTMQPPAQPGPNLADEIRELAELHAQGILSDSEFAAAKQTAISQHRR